MSSTLTSSTPSSSPLIPEHTYLTTLLLPLTSPTLPPSTSSSIVRRATLIYDKYLSTPNTINATTYRLYNEILKPSITNGIKSFASTSSSIDSPSSSSSLSTSLRVMYAMCKCQGLKTISTLLPTTVSLLEDVISYLKHLQSRRDGAEWTWEVETVATMWLSMLLMSPFDISSIDSSFPHCTSSQCALPGDVDVRSEFWNERDGIGNDVVNICVNQAYETGPKR